MLSESAISRTDSAEVERILFIGHFNFDAHPDTAWGRPDKRLNYRLTTIRWGQSDSASPDGGMEPGPVPPALQSRITEIHYPEWEQSGGTVSFQHFNPDSLIDIILYTWGKVGDSLNQRDTLRPIAIFGQHRLDTIAVIDISAIGEFQYDPFFAMELRIGSDFVEPAIRDLSEVPSFVLKPADIAMRPPETPKPPTLPMASIEGQVRIYPNPARISTQVEGFAVPAGEYHVEVVSVNGQVHLRQQVAVDESGNLLRTLDLQRLASGYYVVRLERKGKIIGTYPVIVTR